MLLLRITTHYFLSQEIIILASIICITAPILAFHIWRKGSRPAGYFLLSWSALLFGAILYSGNLLGWLPINTLTTHGILFGSTAEMLLLSLGLADRINCDRTTKLKALSEQNKILQLLKKAEDELIQKALFSQTTGLPNSAFLRNILDQILLNKQYQQQTTLLFFKLNNFHEFNNTLGHNNGDTILRIMGERLNSFCASFSQSLNMKTIDDSHFYVANMENIIFSVILIDQDQLVIEDTTLHIIQCIERPFEYQGMTLNVDASAGMAHFPEHANNSEMLIKNTQIALKSASAKKKKFAQYQPSLDPYSPKRISLIGGLRTAIEQNELDLHFQPQLNLQTQQITGAEVLVRWQHKEFGFVPPDEFIPLAERTGVIHTLTYWICKQAFLFQNRLIESGFNITLSINISARNLQDIHFKSQINQLAKDLNTPLSTISMELTETAIMADPEDAMLVMEDLNQAGITLSIDDFGTGYSSLTYLKQLPVQEIKIDRSFVKDMVTNANDESIVQTTLTMGHNLNLSVVAEGIEDEETLEKLRKLGCDYAQGYHIARPMPGDAFIDWLKNQTFKKQINA